MIIVCGTSSRPQNDIGRCLGPCIRFRGFGVSGSGLEGLGVRVRVWGVEFQVIGWGAGFKGLMVSRLAPFTRQAVARAGDPTPCRFIA